MKGTIVLLVLIIAIMFQDSFQSSNILSIPQVEAKRNKGKVRPSQKNFISKRQHVKTGPNFFERSAVIVDAWYDWFGYKELPHLIRYSLVLFLITAPIYTFFFCWCCVHNDEHEDPEEEKKFMQRYDKWEKVK